MGIFSKLKAGLFKTSESIKGVFSKVFNIKKLDENSIAEIEEALLTADIGFDTTDKIIKELKKLAKKDKEFDENDIMGEMKSIIISSLKGSDQNINNGLDKKPYVVMLSGVNGSGKTTTAAKLTHHFQEQGKKVLMVACDTFRAAAVQQLEVWSQRLKCGFFKGEENADPASVAYKVVDLGINENYDVIIIDTAGRLHNKTNLMDELVKVNKVIKKFDESFPHQNLIVIDGTTGQNAVNQVKEFSNTNKITGIIINKLDGTAKGGILVKIYNEFRIPIYGVGVGEKIDDFKFFNIEEYADNLLGIE